MSRTPAKVTQADISRAIRAARKLGLPTAVELLPDGTVRVVLAQKPGDTAEQKPYEWRL